MTASPIPRAIVILESKEPDIDKVHESAFSEHVESSLRH